MGELSKTQIDKLGERLRKGEDTIDDLILLDQYRDSFKQGFEEAFGFLQENGLEPTGRAQKTTRAIREKMGRQSVRLSRIQDIAGCRIVSQDRLAQNNVVDSLRRKWPDAIIYDRREKPSSGYRAVHVVVNIARRQVEIQVRTELEHHWAETSEKLAQLINPAIKYGGGPTFVRQVLENISETIQEYETLWISVYESKSKLATGYAKAEIENIPIHKLEELGMVIESQFNRLGVIKKLIILLLQSLVARTEQVRNRRYNK